MTEKEKKEFTFISEQVKKKPFYRRKGFIRGCQGAALALIFGGVAGVTFAVVQPWAEQQFGEPDKQAKVVFVPDETVSESSSESESEPKKPTEAESETVKQTETESEQAPPVVEKKELDLLDYKQLYAKMSSVADEALKSIVTVTGESNRVDLLDQAIDNEVQAAGLVIEMNDNEIFILTEKATTDGAQRIVVTFRDGMTANAVLQKDDHVTGLAVVRVSLAQLDESTRLTVKKPNLSGTALIRPGDPVIALGSPVNNSYVKDFGMVTSSVKTPAVDQEYQVLITNMTGGPQSSGILVNLDGRIVGITAQRFSSGSGQTMLSALSLSEIMERVQMLANNEQWTYMGINGKEITESLAKEKKMPRGIYVINVEANSPAMHSGIQSADILVSIDGEEIETMAEYVKELQKHEPDSQVKVVWKRDTFEGYENMEEIVTLGRG